MTEVVLTPDHLEDVVSYFLELDEWAFDTETKGKYRLDPKRNEVFWIQFGGLGRNVVIPFGHPIGKFIGYKKVPRTLSNGTVRNFKTPCYSKPPVQMRPGTVFDMLKPLFFGNDALKFGHNIKFDLESIAKYYDDVIPDGPFWDTQITDFLLDENKRTYNLGDVVFRTFGVRYDKSLSKAVETFPFDEAAFYCHNDAHYTYMLGRHQKPLVPADGIVGVHNLEMDLIEALCYMELAGAPADIEAIEAADKDLDRSISEYTKQLYRIAGREWNFASAPQRVAVFYGKRAAGGQALKVRKKTPSGAPSCDEEALKYHVGNDLVDTYLEYQEIEKISSTYVKSYLGTGEAKAKDKSKNNAPPYNRETGRIHANFKQHGAKTGRFSCSAPNLQNIPRPDTELGKKIRGFFIAPPGETLIVADWSQIEYRILAKYSGDPRLIQTFLDGVDFHLYVASLLLGKPMSEVTSVERTVCKNCNFATVYGAGPAQVASMSGVAIDLVEEFMEVHKRMLPKVYRFNDQVVRTCRSRRPPYVKTILGRKRRLPEINWRGNWAASSYAERQAVNTVIQGSAADLMKLAIVRLHATLPEDMHLLLTVHDELVMSVPDDRVEDGLAVMREAMEGKEIADLIAPVPLVADIHAVKRWSDAKAA